MVVAATKLLIPTSRRPVVARPHLHAALDGDYRVALVSAPAGYGKTAALAAWASEQPGRVAWLSCDPLDVEPTRFMSCLLATISATWPGVADDAMVLLEREGADTYDPAVAVANALAALDAPGVIVVDDLHLAAPDPTMLAAFIEALPPRFRFVAGTRSDPPLSLARLRLRGELLELRGDDLRFTPEELADFLTLQGVELGTDLERLHELTEGWPAGAQMAAIALPRRAGNAGFLEAFTTTERAVGDFLLSEVLASLQPNVVDFLIATSVLEEFDADLCAAVTGIEDAGVLLEQLLAANVFIVPLSEPPRWYRYHHLFGAFLRARLASLGRSRLRSAHERASAALQERGDVAAALRHAMTIGDSERTGQILRATVARSMSLSDGADDTIRAVRLWLHEVGETFVGSEPALVLELLIGLIGLTRPDDATVWLERIRVAHPEADGTLRALLEGAWNEHHQNHGQPLEAIRRVQRALDAVDGRPPNVGLLPLLFVTAARAHIQAGDFGRAVELIDAGHAHPVGSPVADETRNRGVAAFIAAVDGELTHAAELVRRTTESADRLGLGGHEVGRLYAGLATVEIHLDRQEHDEARDVMDRVQAAADRSRRITVQSLVTLQHAKLARTIGDQAGADRLLARATLFFPDGDAAVRSVLAEEAVAQALRFDPAAAQALLAELDADRPATATLRARSALIDGDRPAAAALLAGAPVGRSRRERVERSVLLALSVADRDAELANEHLAAALAAARPESLVRTVIQAGPRVHQLLTSYTPRGDEHRDVAVLLAASSRDVAPIRVPTVQALVDPLSTRELTVLRYLASRLTYQEIAGALYISLNTLKSHVRAVYRKLGVASRSDAIGTGRHLGLI